MLVSLRLWNGQAYVDFDDGVYAYASRQLLNGGSLYHHPVAAQPPPIYWLGAAALFVHDSVHALRAVVALSSFVTSALVAISVLRLTGRPDAGLVTGLAAIVAPWALRLQGDWTTESFVAPLLMGAAVLGPRRAGSWAAGAVAGLAGMFKLSYLLPAAIIIAAAKQRRAAFAALALTVGAIGGISLAVFGSAVFTDVVRAQLEVGTAPLRGTMGLWRLAAEEMAPLLALAAFGWTQRHRMRDPRLADTLALLCVAGVTLLVTVMKHGTGLGVLRVVEPPAIALATAGAVVALDMHRGRARSVAIVLVALAIGWMGAQSVSILASPKDTFLGYAGNEWEASGNEVSSAVKAARRCPPPRAYSGSPYVAFLARRRVPGNEPDQFIIRNASSLEFALRRAEADRPRCP